MENSPLAPELERLERLLTFGPQPEPSAGLQQRVLGDVRAELHQQRLARLRSELFREQRRSRRRFALACAATILAGLGFSFGVMHAGGFALRPPASAPTVYDVARQLQQLAPAVSQRDLLAQATVRQIGAEASCGEILNNLFADTKSHDR